MAFKILKLDIGVVNMIRTAVWHSFSRKSTLPNA